MLRRDSGERVRKELPFAGYSVVKEPERGRESFSQSSRVENDSRPHFSGGEYRARTGDLLVANQALSQLS